MSPPPHSCSWSSFTGTGGPRESRTTLLIVAWTSNPEITGLGGVAVDRRCKDRDYGGMEVERKEDRVLSHKPHHRKMCQS